MAQTKHVLKLSAIANFFCPSDERRLIARGENAVESNHVKSFHFIPDLLLLRGEVHASMRDRVYKVEVNLDKEGEIKSCSCTCPRGEYLCHHVAAICIYGHHNISVTDVECRWVARKTKDDDIKTIDELYVGKTHQSTNHTVSEDQKKNFCENLEQFGSIVVGFSWLLRPEPPLLKTPLIDIEEFLFSVEYFSTANKRECFLNKVKISMEIINSIQESTIGQSKNENWLISRKNRLTASNFGAVLAAIRRKKYPPSLYKRLTGFYNLDKINAVQWGVINESQAIIEFSNATGLEVVPSGLWLDSCGFLGGSPDGLIGDNAIIEVKCPYSRRNTKSLTTDLTTDHSYIIYVDQDGKYILNKSHDYYHQIQGNMAFTKRDLCYLMLWTPTENIVMEINRDIDWEENLLLLHSFYIDQYLPFIIDNVLE